MPARRSRTENWRETLQTLQDRNGAIEISLPGGKEGFYNPPAPGESDDGGGAMHAADHELGARSLIWRVRVLQVSEDAIYVEQPMVLRQRIMLEPGVELIGVLASGPNRWMFHTRNRGLAKIRLSGGRETVGLKLAMPQSVERCQRRSFYRISTVGLLLPKVEVFPLLDPETIPAAEVANRAEILDRMHGGTGVAGRVTPDGAEAAHPLLMPEVGPGFTTTLVNIGGGGVGLLVDPLEASGLATNRLFWLRVHLMPQIPAPLGITARLVHTHLDTNQRTYAGMAFDFSFNRSHESFVVTEICRYVAAVQRDQLRRQALSA